MKDAKFFVYFVVHFEYKRPVIELIPKSQIPNRGYNEIGFPEGYISLFLRTIANTAAFR